MPTRIPLQHTPPAFVPDGAWFFVTICCEKRGANALCTDLGAGVLADAAHYHATGVWRAHLFLLMPDHLHAVVTVGVGGRLAEVVRNWKRLTARRHGIAWQRGFFDHRLRAGENFELKCRYIRENPVRAGLISQAEDWPYFLDHVALEGR